MTTLGSIVCRSSFSSESECLASPVMTSTGPFSSWLLMALYRMNSGSPACSWEGEIEGERERERDKMIR